MVYLQLLMLGLAILLPYNLLGALFLGDAGSYSIGATIGLLMIYVHNQADGALPMLTVVLWLMVPVVDCLRVMMTRSGDERSPLSADKNHLHHRLARHWRWPICLLIYLGLVAAPGSVGRSVPGADAADAGAERDRLSRPALGDAGAAHGARPEQPHPDLNSGRQNDVSTAAPWGESEPPRPASRRHPQSAGVTVEMFDDRGIDRAAMGQWQHVTGPRNRLPARVRQGAPQELDDPLRGRCGHSPGQQQRRHPDPAIGAERYRLRHGGREVERDRADPAAEILPPVRAAADRSANAVPIVDEASMALQ